MITDVSLTLELPDKKLVKTGTLEIYHLGKMIKTVPFKNGTARFAMPVNAIIKVIAEGQPVIRRGLYLDFEPHRKLMESLANGDWRDRAEFSGKVFPGYIPWKAFQLEETRNLLRQVSWRVTLEPNDRDKQWEKFEQLFLPDTSKQDSSEKK